MHMHAHDHAVHAMHASAHADGVTARNKMCNVRCARTAQGILAILIIAIICCVSRLSQVESWDVDKHMKTNACHVLYRAGG